MSIRTSASLLAALFSFCLGADSAETPDAPLPSVAIVPEARFRARSFARETTPIVNPIRWVQFVSRTPEGTRVREGETVFTVDLSSTREDLDNIANQLKERRNQAETRLAELRETGRKLRDRVEELRDSRGIQAARLAWLESLPREQDLAIAEGRLKVADRNLEAAEREAVEARDRLDRGLVAPAALEEAELELRSRRARARYAERRLDTARQSTPPERIRIVETRIANLDLEIGKLDREIETQQTLYAIEETSQERRVAELEERRKERLEELKHREIPSPMDGVLLYSPRLKRELAQGSQLPKEALLAEIPHPGSVALRGKLPERLRHLFRPGDPVEVVLNMYPDQVWAGRLESISPFSRDIREEEEVRTGVKMVNVVATLDDPPEGLPLGIHGWATLRAAEPRKGPVVPVSWVRFRGGDAYLSVNGVYRTVPGVVSGDRYQLGAPHPPLEAISETGEWEEADVSEIDPRGDRFVATGELSPVESVAVEVPRLRSWDIKVAWLHPENTLVQAGEPLARLDSEQIRKRVEDLESETKQRMEERESAAEELSIQLRERDFKVQSAENLLTLKQLERDLTHGGVDAAAAQQADLDLATAELDLERARNELERMERRPEFTAPAARKRQVREVARAELGLERARVLRDQAYEGADDVDRSLADLEVLRQTAETARIRAQTQQAVSRARSRLRWRTRRERHLKERLEQARRDLASMEIAAPSSGLVEYGKLWDGVKRSKLKTGMRVWRGSRMISLSDTEEVFVDLPVPERHVRHLELDMPVRVRIPSEGAPRWEGRVTRFAAILEPAENPSLDDNLYGDREVPMQQILTVRVRVESAGEDNLKPGAIAHIVFPFEK